MLEILFYHAFFFLFLIIDLYFQIPTVIPQIFNPTAELAMSIGILNSDEKAEIKTYLDTAETNIFDYSIYFKVTQTFWCFLLIKSLCFIFSMKYFLILSIFFNLNS